MVANRRPPSAPTTKVIALEAASAASFHPLKAQISAGALNPSGRYSHWSGCIRLSVDHGAMSSGETTAGAISGLRPGQEGDGVVACSRTDRRFTRTGSPYLALELRDRSGTIAARAFQDADALAGRFERGDLVRVSGRVERFRDQPVLEVVEISKVPTEPGASGSSETADPALFLPVAYRDLDELDGFLEHLG